MGASGSVTPGDDEDKPQNIQFVKGGSAITSDSYDLYNGGTYVSPTVSGVAPGATLTYDSSDPAVATVSSAGVVTPVGEGETTISVNASKVEGYQAGYAEFTLTVTDSTPDAVDQPLKFMKNMWLSYILLSLACLPLDNRILTSVQRVFTTPDEADSSLFLYRRDGSYPCRMPVSPQILFSAVSQVKHGLSSEYLRHRSTGILLRRASREP